MNRLRLLAAALGSMVSVGACNRDQPPAPALVAPPASAPAPTPSAAESPSASAEPPAPTKPDPVSVDSLKEGLLVMQPRVVAEVDGLSKIGTNDHYRFFIHPGEKKAASVEFDTKGLTSLVLSPFMADFSTDQGCTMNPQAGVARLTWYIDGKKKGSVMVDRNYTGFVNVDLAKSSRLKLEVDAGNGVIWCDWFTVGMVNVKAAESPAAPSASAP